jgi:molybdopterin converting factor small subunit
MSGLASVDLQPHYFLTLNPLGSNLYIGRNKKMKPHIQIKLFANLQPFMPSSGEKYHINPGTSIRNLLEELNVPQEKARLIFIDGVKADLSSTLEGGERVGIFPPVGGG